MEKPNKALQHKIQEVHQLLLKQKVKAATTLLNELHQERPSEPRVLLLLGVAALKEHDFETALSLLQQALSLDDNLSEAHFYLATLYLHQAIYDKAIEQYQKVSNLDASYVLAQMNLGVAFENKGRFKEAQIIYEKMLHENPQEVHVYLALGNVLVKLDKISEAIAIYERGLILAPKSLDLLNHLGMAFHKASLPTKALKCFNKVLAIKPENAQALFYLSQLYNASEESFPHTKLIQQCLHHKDLSSENRILYHFALGNVFDVSKDPDKAFYHFEKGNSSCAKIRPFDESVFLNKVDEIKALFNELCIGQKKILASNRIKPVFIVGMSKTGKKLLAKALQTHPDIACVPSQRLLAEQAEKMLIDPSLLQQANTAFLVKLAQDYCEEINKIANKETSFLIDVSDDNYLYLGLIAILFPDSLIIHCTRHPLDLCLSNYFHYQHQHAFSHHLVLLAKYYQTYAKLMSYWQSIGIENRVEVKYEELVQEPQRIIQQLYSYLDLPNNEANMPPFHTNEVERWKQYQHHLQPLIDVLYNT